MLNPKVEKFLEDNNMTYLFLMLANLEVARLSNLPDIIKKKFEGKITETALEHVAENIIPDYLADMPELPEEEDENLNPFE
ncbi:MAG: hypothetical protein RAO94_13920 [Candidatus Stygibacter australis]|nr:hypothetical protein [Candidatus Stygibacter australis]